MSDYKDPRGKSVRIQMPDGRIIDNPDPATIDTTIAVTIEMRVPIDPCTACDGSGVVDIWGPAGHYGTADCYMCKGAGFLHC